MPKRFFKNLNCGCVVVTITCGIQENTKMYLLGGHMHHIICNKCQQIEESGEDILYDMWESDNLTNDLGYAGWKNEGPNKC
jgi:hypothetical protein